VEEQALPNELRLMRLLVEGMAANHAACWTRSLACLKEHLQLARRHNDVISQFHALNNLLCVSMDTGRWDEVDEIHREISALTKVMPHICRATLFPEVNYAEARFTQARYREAIARLESVLDSLSDQEGTEDLETSAKCTLGLALLAASERGRATEIWRGLPDESWEGLAGTTSRDQIVWFHAFMGWRDAPAAVSRRMQAVGEEDVASHRVAGLRILWLRDLFESAETGPVETGDPEQGDAARRLREIDNGWFLRFSRRWLEAARTRAGSPVPAAT
jgi:hypothetical protein